MGKKLTLQDIADKAGVSKATVYRAINNKGDINQETKQTIMDIVKKLDYRPNKVARSLALKNSKKIGVVLRGIPSFYWGEVEKGIKKAEEELNDFGIQVIIHKMDELRSPEQMIILIDKLVEQKVDAIVMVPLNSSKLKEKIIDLDSKGITVVTINDDIDVDARKFYVGPHIFQSGKVAGELMGKFLRGKGNVVVINGVLESLTYEERSKGFAKVINDEYPDIDIVANYNYDFIKSQSHNIKIIKNILESIPDLSGIYDVDGASLYQIGNIVKSSSKLKDVVLIGHEIWEGVEELIEKDIIQATISQDPFAQGYFSIKLLYNFLIDNQLPDYKRMYTRLDIIMQGNMKRQENILNPYYIK
ncbi:MAG: substrate-binding domain-containing protein [Clostridia bacterium]|nr:substrate-binding domain-containing protein [Clostridia bacterium]